MKTFGIAIFFVAAYAISTGAVAQKVYKCGSTYSQTPCTDAVQVNTGDARTAVQKKDSEKATSRDMKAAKSMEKERLADERKAQAAGRESAQVIEKINAAPAPKESTPPKAQQHKDNTPKKKPAKKPVAKSVDDGKK